MTEPRREDEGAGSSRGVTAAVTPPAWRAAALATLLGGGVLGFVAAGGRRGGWLLGAGVAAALGSTVPIILASRRPPIPPGAAALDPDGPTPTFSVVVAARDEAAALPGLIGDLGAQDHRSVDGRPMFELIVIDDRSVDGTPQVALRAAAAAGLGDVTRLVRRTGDVPDGKGAALTAAPPEMCRGDVVVVLDADARVGPRFLSTLAVYVAAGADAITPRRRVIDAHRSDLAGAQADEQTADGLIQRGRWALGGCSEFRGNGIVVRRTLLAELGGWRAEALTEDLDLSSRLAAARGLQVAWAIDAEVWEQPVGKWSDLWRQRVRWAEGAVRRTFEHAPAVLRSSRLTIPARLDFATYAAQLAMPPLLLGAVAGAARSRRFGPAAGFVAAYVAAAAGLGWDALRWEQGTDGAPLGPGERARRAGRLALFGIVWIAAVPAALWRLATRRGAVVYDKMEHAAAGEVGVGAGASAEGGPADPTASPDEIPG